MSTSKTPCFYYPTTVVIVDDNKVFLNNLPDNLSEAAHYQLFDCPMEALNFLESQLQNVTTPDDFLGVTDDLVTGLRFNVNIPKIHSCLYNKDRFKTTSVIIVDHDMPGMSGLEFCEKLRHYPIKKVMLTGAADHKLAVQAFNEGIIHKFIAKDEANIFEVINQVVRVLQREYFLRLSEQITKNINTITFSFLFNKAFQDFFEKFINQNDIVEFYLIDPIGSFLLINKKGKILRLIVQSDREIENYCQTAVEHSATEEIIVPLTSKENLLCLFSEEDFNQSVDKWKMYLHPAHKIDEVTGGYYAVVRDE